MPGFTTAIVFAGVLIFVGGLVALGAQKARQMGAPHYVSTTGSWIAAAALLGALSLGIIGITYLGSLQEAGSEQTEALDQILE